MSDTCTLKFVNPDRAYMAELVEHAAGENHIDMARVSAEWRPHKALLRVWVLDGTARELAGMKHGVFMRLPVTVAVQVDREEAGAP